MRFYVLVTAVLAVLFSCGKSVDKNSFEGRVSSLMAANEDLSLAISMDLQSVIKKSGILDGALPEQYLSTAKPYLDALMESVNLEKQVFMMPAVDFNNPEQMGAVVMFDIKNVDRLKKEFKELGVNLTKKGNIEFGIKDEIGLAIFKNETGVLVFSDDKIEISEAHIQKYVESLSKGKTMDGLDEFVMTKADMAMFTPADRISADPSSLGLSSNENAMNKYNELMSGTHTLMTMNFNDQEAVLDFKGTFGKGMKKFLPILKSKASKEAQAVLISDDTFLAYSMNMDMGKLIDILLSMISEEDKAQLDKTLMMAGGLDKVRNFFTGEMSMAMSPPKNGSDAPETNFYLGIGDIQQVKSLVDGFGSFLSINKSGDDYEMEGNVMSFTKTGLVFSTNKANLSSLKYGKSANARKMEGFSFGGAGMTFFADFAKMKKLANNDEDLLNIMSKFDFVIAEINQNDGTAKLRSTDKTKNILRTLVELGVDMAQKESSRYQDDTDWGSEDWDDEEWDTEDMDWDDVETMVAPM